MNLRHMIALTSIGSLVAIIGCGPSPTLIAMMSPEGLKNMRGDYLCYAKRYRTSPNLENEITRRNLDCTAMAVGAKNQMAPPTASQSQTATSDKGVFTDPKEYCRAVATSDDPLQDTRYKGPKATEQMAAVLGISFEEAKVVDGSGATNYKIAWRCANGKVLVCDEGNSPICGRAATDRAPSDAMIKWCRTNPNTDIPAAITGHFTIFAWNCVGKKPVAGRQLVKLDADGYDVELWKEVNSNGDSGYHKTSSRTDSNKTSKKTAPNVATSTEPLTCSSTQYENLTTDQGKALKFLLEKMLSPKFACITKIIATDKFPLRGQTVVKYEVTVAFPNGYRTECLTRKNFETNGFNGVFHQLNCSDTGIKPAAVGEVRTYTDEDII